MIGFAKKLAASFNRWGVGVRDDNWLRTIVLGAAASGAKVTEQNALQTTTVICAIRVIAENLASLPLFLMRQIDDRRKRKATDHPLYRLLHDAPNEEMDSMVFRETQQAQVCGWGNCYAEIERDFVTGTITNLWPMPASKVEPTRDDVTGKLVYKVRVPKTFGTLMEHEEIVPASNVLHVPGLGFDGRVGYNPIQLGKNAIGLAAGSEEFASKFLANGAMLSVILEHPGSPSEKARKNIIESFERRHRGLKNAYRVALLEEAMKTTTVGISPEASQLLEQRRFQTLEIARLFRVPPHLLYDLERSTHSNIEHQSIEFVTYTLRPWMVRWEQILNRKLLSEDEKAEFYFKHNADAILRGDTQSRYQAHKLAWEIGLESVNEARELEDLDPIEGGDTHFVPLNFHPLEQAIAMTPDERTRRGATKVRIEPEEEDEAADEEDDEEAANASTIRPAQRLALVEAVERVMAKEGWAAIKAAENSRDFLAWIETFYAKNGDLFISILTTPLAVCDEQLDWVRPLVAAELVERHVAGSRARLIARYDTEPAATFREAIAADWDAAVIRAIAEHEVDEWLAAKSGEPEPCEVTNSP